MSNDWKKGAETLATLPFNRLFRETPIEALLRVIANQQVNKTRVLVGECSWTPTRSRSGSLVRLGLADENGVYLDDCLPSDANGRMGFFLSRSDTAKSES